MRSLLVVGADHLGLIPNKLSAVGFDKILHMDGRKAQKIKKNIPSDITCILVLTDYVNHNLAKSIKERAKDESIPIYYAKRSWCSIYQAMKYAV
ncbi:DUF2325 domain-containing protein [Bacillus piscicola]|uniref:DUF2325 domain-containing protein n=1 Tax=Bacillus piscicola TaxID=1632684 RepID=UPI001F08BDC2|nr:DUF2325 domain-containing protein [Bacillus piscicola]